MLFHDFASTRGLGEVAPLTDEQLMQAIAAVGGTVFADRFEWSLDPYYGDTMAMTLNRAHLARKHGLRYFGNLHSAYLPYEAKKINARLAVNRDGKNSYEDTRVKDRHVPCPLDADIINRWLFDHAVEMAESGLVDGCVIDWEMAAHGFSGLGDETCYCDNCFDKYQRKKGLKHELAPEERWNWLNQQGLLREYLIYAQERLIAIYRLGAERIRAIKPDFIFSAYSGFMPGHIRNFWRIEATAIGLHSPEVPFFVVDSMHYSPNHTFPWWDTGYPHFKKLGMKFILGSYVRGIMGGLPEMDVSAVQWIYDAAINTDGYWVWSERTFGPRDYAIHRTANKRIRDVENKVGDFLFKGTEDSVFVTAVEQSGDPVLSRNIVTRTFHLGDRHLVHVNNVNSYRPVEALVRFPRLKREGNWTVTDPMSDVKYAHEANHVVWPKNNLKKGILLSMEKRSDAWLVVAPHTAHPVKTGKLQTVSGTVIKGHPDRPATKSILSAGKPVSALFPLVFARCGPLGYAGPHQPVLGTSIYFVDAAAGGDMDDRQVFAIKGNCWSPKLSPDQTRVVFSSYVNGKGQIYTVNADATVETGPPGTKRLNKPYMDTTGMHWRSGISFGFKAEGVNNSNNNHCEHSPVWSPDGRRIAYVSDRDVDWEIYLMNADGSDRRRLTRSPGIDRAPAWSPDGNQIAFESNRNGDFDIYLIGCDGTDEMALVKRSGDDSEPCWSPDGVRIACVSNQHNSFQDITIVDTKTHGVIYPKGLTRPATSWWVYDRLHDIRWSPDNRYIAAAFESSDMGHGFGILVARADGTEVKELVTAPLRKPHPGGTNRPLLGGWYLDGSASHPFVVPTFRDLAWSPDSKTIAFRSDLDPSGYEFFYTVPAQGGEVTRLSNTLSPMGLKNEPKPLNVSGQP